VSTSPEPDDLPFVDEYRVTVAAPREQVWNAVRRYAGSSLRIGAGNPLGWLLGTVPRAGFEVVREAAPVQLALAGRHRFSRYRLVFEVSEGATGQTIVAARTYAVFPGLHGGIYRALVIGTRAHAAAVRGMLRAISRTSLR
jgi:hypothetical protein